MLECMQVRTKKFNVKSGVKFFFKILQQNFDFYDRDGHSL